MGVGVGAGREGIDPIASPICLLFYCCFLCAFILRVFSSVIFNDVVSLFLSIYFNPFLLSESHRHFIGFVFCGNNWFEASRNTLLLLQHKLARGKSLWKGTIHLLSYFADYERNNTWYFDKDTLLIWINTKQSTLSQIHNVIPRWKKLNDLFRHIYMHINAYT